MSLRKRDGWTTDCIKDMGLKIRYDTHHEDLWLEVPSIHVGGAWDVVQRKDINAALLELGHNAYMKRLSAWGVFHKSGQCAGYYKERNQALAAAYGASIIWNGDVYSTEPVDVRNRIWDNFMSAEGKLDN